MRRLLIIIGIILFLPNICIAHIGGRVGEIGLNSEANKIVFDVSNFTSLIAHYTMNDNENNTTVIDRSRNSNTGTAVRNTNAISTTGKVGNAFTFDGTDDKIDCGSDFIGTTATTACAWIYPTGWGENNLASIINNGKFVWRIQQTNARTALFSDGATAATALANSISLNTWQFVAITRDTSGQTVFYIDGVVSDNSDPASGTPTVGDNNVILGNIDGATRTFDGKIDNLMIFNEVLTANQILQLYNRGAGRER